MYVNRKFAFSVCVFACVCVCPATFSVCLSGCLYVSLSARFPKLGEQAPLIPIAKK